MIVVSPWSRGGFVCSQVFDHTSVLRFLESWTGVAEPNISGWRRAVCGDLTAALDLRSSTATWPSLPAPVDPGQGSGVKRDAAGQPDHAGTGVGHTVTATGDAAWSQRFVGHIETGTESVSG